MARRRVNTKFLGILALGIVGVGGAGYGVQHFLLKESPKKYVARAQVEVREGNLLGAEKDYAKAVGLNPGDLQVKLEYGDVLHELSRTQPQQFSGQQEIAVWNSILATDPTNVGALKRLLTVQVEAVELYSRPETFSGNVQRLHDLADKILQLPPPAAGSKDQADVEATRLKAEAYLHISTLAGWLQGIATPDETIASETAALDSLRAKDPGNSDIPYYLAQSYIQQAKEARVGGDPDKSKKLFERAVSVFEQALVAPGQEENAVLFLRYYQVLRRANEQYREDDEHHDAERFVPRMDEVLAKARSFVKKDDPAYADVFIQSAEFMFRRNTETVAAAEKILRELMANKPDDQNARLTLARLIHTDPSKRPEAIDLLRKEITDTGISSALAYRNLLGLQLETWMALSNYLIEQWGVTPDAAKRDELLKEINANYDKVQAKAPLFPQTLKLKAKIAGISGPDGAIRSIPILEQAIELDKTVNGPRNFKDWELEYMLAKAYFDSRQSGEAKNRLFKITEQFPAFVPAHVLLCELLMQEGSSDLAAAEIQTIQKIAPTEPALDRLRIAYFASTKGAGGKENQKELVAAMDKMPETTNPERMAKVQVALAVREFDAATRLLRDVLAAEPANVQVIAALVQIYQFQNKPDQAIAVVKAALAKSPNDKQLQFLDAQLAKKSPEELFELERQLIMTIKDDGDRESKLYDLYKGANKPAEAAAHLDAWEKAKPDSKRLMDIRFQVAIQDKDFDKAGAYAQKLGAINADEAQGRIYQYRLALARGDIGAATEIAKEMVKTLGQFARSYLCLAEVQKMQGQYNEAASNYGMALQRQTENIDAIRGMIDCNYALEKPDDARRYIELGLRLNPGNADFKEKLIAWELNYGDPVKAIAPREADVKANPDALGPRLGLGAAYFQVAQVLTKKNHPDQARPYLQKAVATFTDVVAKYPDERLGYAYLADIAAFAGNFADGERALKAMADRPAYVDKTESYTVLGDYYVRFGKNPEAEAAFKTALEKSKNSVDMQLKLAAFYAATGQYDKATAVLDAKSTDRRVRAQIIETLIAGGKMDAARGELEKQLQANPRDAQFRAMLGFVQLNSKPVRLAEALASMNAALEVDPKNQTALYYRGVIYLRATPANTEDALRDLTAARNMNPRNVQVRIALAEAHHLRHEDDEAGRELEAVLAFQPQNKDVRMRLIELYGMQSPARWSEVERLLADAKTKVRGGEADADWYRVEANMWNQRKEPEKALTLVRKAIELAKAQPERLGPLLRDYLTFLLQAQKYELLAAECDRLLQDKNLSENSWWGYQLRAVARCNLNRKPEAMTDYDVALGIAAKMKDDEAVATIIQNINDTIGTDEAIARVEREFAKGNMQWGVIGASLYMSQGQYASAKAMIEKVLEPSHQLTAPERTSALTVAGQVYMIDKSLDKAIATYTALQEMNPGDTLSLNNLACLYTDYMVPPKPDRALEYSRRAVESMQERGLTDPNILDTHGWVLVLNNKSDDGMRFLRAAIERRPIVEAYYHLGRAFLMNKQASDAQQQLETALRLLEEKKAKKQQVDPALEKDINAYLAQAKQMMQGAANANP